ncbi:MAG: hypothetical protein WCW61_04010 [Patescibacteria group bacterium]|jgi:hypothetical protein
MPIKKRDKSGVASIPLVLGLLILIISVGLFISSISLSDSLATSNQDKSNLALEYAQIGAKEALVKIARQPCNSCSNSFQIETLVGGCSGGIAGCITVDYAPLTAPTSSEIVITSEGHIYDISRTVQVNAILDNYGKIASYTWQ